MSGDTLGGLVLLMLLVLAGVIPVVLVRHHNSRVEDEDPRIPPHALHQLNRRITQERIENPDRQS